MVVACAHVDTFTDITEDQRRQLRNQIASKHHFSFFSDSIAVTSPYWNDDGQPLIQHVFTLLVSLSCMMIVSPNRRSVVRGAVEVGGGFEWPEGGVYGPIMADVYELENQTARYPRIVVGPELSNCICDWNRKAQENNAYYVGYRELIELCKGMICADRDGVQILDYLGPAFSRFARPHMANHVKSGFDFVTREYDKFKDGQEPQMALKYSLFKEYYSDRLKVWTF